MKSISFSFFLVGLLAVTSFASAQSLASELSGRILLQVEQNGEAWYVVPSIEKRVYLGRPSDALNVMQTYGLGISESDFEHLNTNDLRRLAGYILLRVESFGQAYYVDPVSLDVHALDRPSDALSVMRTLGLGITDADLSAIPIEEIGNIKEDVDDTANEYEVAPGGLSGWFETGQDASIMLSGIDFDQTGGSLLFNHPGGLATNGENLLMVDKYNNRVLIWNEAPSTDNVEPDVVLGQPDFDTNTPGSNLDDFNWPTSIATDGERLVVSDTENDRVLIWNEFPTTSKEPADFAISNNLTWPWGVWTDGEKLIVTGTGGDSSIRIWNTFPTDGSLEADVVIEGDDFGTPRTVGSDGTNLIIGDHNGINSERTTFFWHDFPTQNNDPYDFAVENGEGVAGDLLWSPTVLEDGRVLGLVNKHLAIWNQFPTDVSDGPDLLWGDDLQSGAASGIAVVGDQLFLSLHNRNMLIGFSSIPESEDVLPDVVIGSSDYETNTLLTNHFLSNPFLATHGEQLFVTSDFDRALSVWNALPNESGVYPDASAEISNVWDTAIYKDTMVGIGKQGLLIWDELPKEAQAPDVELSQIGSVAFEMPLGVALDDTYLYVADYGTDTVYVWDQMPDSTSEPVASLNVEGPWRLSSDGEYLAVTSIYSHHVSLYDVSTLEFVATVGGVGTFNLPQYALVADGHLFVADTGFNRVHVWEDIQKAIEGLSAEVLLGTQSSDEYDPAIGQDSLFWPASLAFDGSYLWVGEFKFSGRILRFDISS